MKLRSRLLLAALLCGLATASSAALLSTRHTQVGGSRWSVELVLANDDGRPAAIEAFSAYFDETLFANLALLASPEGWDTITVAPSATIPAPGFIDALATDPAHALGLGAQAAGFRVQFDFLGSGAPGTLSFEIHDPLTFEIIATGTSVDLPGSAVPEPASRLLVLLATAALAAAGGLRRRAGAAR